jgi:hypothetical protein
LVEWGDLGFSDIDADGEIVKRMLGAELAESGGHGLGSDIGKAESVNESMLMGITKDTWLGIPRLRVERDGA